MINNEPKEISMKINKKSVGTGLAVAGVAAASVWLGADMAWADPIEQPKIDGKGVPGLEGLKNVVNAIAAYVLVTCMGAFLLGLVATVAGKAIGAAQVASMGKGAIGAAIVVAFVFGLAAAILNFAYNAG